MSTTKTTLPQANTFHMVLEALEKKREEDPWEWNNHSQFICHVIVRLQKRRHITEAEAKRATTHVDSMLYPEHTLANWLNAQGFSDVYCNDSKANDHRIEWVKRIIKELS